ncbi:uncharacterized protein V1518DRAFT_416015 [Limtongia smithiae]|uniref:uncharacterized protein n=1 Tax=Limtongia smithiae TaxID=1125753 RepID=UPI0034CDD925
MADYRQLLRKYSEVYTVFLPLFTVFLIVYTVLVSVIPDREFAPPEDTSDLLLYLHRNLIEISSVTGTEGSVAKFLDSYLKSTGWTVELQPISSDPNRMNVFAYRGSERKTKVLLSSHIDTVPPFIPYSVHDGFIWGRGSVDAKASVAAQIVAATELLSSEAVEAEGDIALLYVVGEEAEGIGMTTANDLGLSWDAVIFGEPTELKLAVGHKGLLGADLVATGHEAHSGYPELGINAVYYLIDALFQLQTVSFPYSDLLGNTTFNAGTLKGGVAANVIPANASAELTVRVAADLPGVVSMIESIVDMIPHVTVDFTTMYAPVRCDYEVPGFDTTVASYGTDIPHLNGSHARYLYGPGSILLAHVANEHIGEEELRDSVVGYKKLVAHSLGKQNDFKLAKQEL